MIIRTCLLVLGLSGCVSPSTTTNPYVATAITTVSVIALSPGGGAMGEAVAQRLAEQGFGVMPAETTGALMQRQGLASVERLQLGGLGFFTANGVDAVLIVRGPEAGFPADTARATVLRVPDGRAIAESRWRSRFGLDEADDGIADRLAMDIARRLRG